MARPSLPCDGKQHAGRALTGWLLKPAIVTGVMSKSASNRKATVGLTPDAPPRPSRIRREPPPLEKPKQLRTYASSEREQWIVVIGVILFALAIAVITFGVSEYTK